MPVNIVVRAGSYNENVTLLGNIHLTAAQPARSFSTQINGNVTLASGGVASMRGIHIVASSGDALTVTGTANPTQLYIYDANVEGNGSAPGDNAVEISTVLGGSSGVIFDNVNFRKASANPGTAANVISGTLQGTGGTFNGGNTTATAISVSESGGVIGRAWVKSSDVFGPIVLSQTTLVGPNPTSALDLANSQVRSGNLRAIQDNTPNIVQVTDSYLQSSVAGDIVSSDGTMFYGQLTFLPGSQTMPASATQLPGTAPAASWGTLTGIPADIADGDQDVAAAWANITGKPSGLDDGDDVGPSYTAGSGLTLGGNEFSIGATQVTDSMIAGMSASKLAGSVTNSQIASLDWLKLTNVPVDIADGDQVGATTFGELLGIPAGLLDGDNDTTYSNGAGLTLTGTTFSIGASQVIDSMIVGMSASKLIGSIGDAQISDLNFSKLTSVPAGLLDGDDDTTYTAGNGLTLSGTTFSIGSNQVTDSMIAGMSTSKLVGTVSSSQIAANAIDSSKIADGSVSTADIANDAVDSSKITNLTRRVMVPASSFIGYNAFAANGTNNNQLVGQANFNAGSVRQRAAAPVLGNNSDNVLTGQFVVPMDYVAGQAMPQLTIYWGTDEGGDRRVNVDVHFDVITNITGATSNVPFRYNFRSGASNNVAMESISPAQGAIGAQVIPEPGDIFSGSPTWNPGDVIIFSIGRNNDSSDPNNGNFYFYGLMFDYAATR